MNIGLTTSPATAAFAATSWLSNLAHRRGAHPAASPAADHSLDRSSIARIDCPQGRRITCTSGALWLTFDGEPEDTVLEAGQSMVCQQDTPLLISAFSDASWSMA